MAIEDNKNNDEAEIKRVIEGGVEGIRARDIDGILSMYAPDLLSYMLAAGVREAKNLRSQARRHDSEHYAGMPISKLAGVKVPEVGNQGNERYRRAVWTLMQWNEAHRPLERWYITTRSIQKLVGGRKEAINAYVDVYQDEIWEHHARLS